MEGINAATTSDLDLSPAEERDRAVDAQDWDEQMDADMKLYPNPSRKDYPKLQNGDIALMSLPN